MVKEYFLALEEPLIPFGLFPYFMEILEKAEKKDRMQLDIGNRNEQVRNESTIISLFPL